MTTRLKGNQLNRFRREKLGFIFQEFNLLDTLTAFENIALALSIQNVPAVEITKRVHAMALAQATRCFCPPDISYGYFDNTDSISSSSSIA